MRGRRWARVVAASCTVGALAAYATSARSQQTSGSTGATVGGAALGLYSGAVLGSIGSWIPCNRTYQSMTCVRVSTALGGAIGMAGGIALGAADQDRMLDAAKAGGIGFVAGAAVGLAMKPFLEGFTWLDVTAVGVMGGAVGASALGATVGFGAGTLVGLALWQFIPSFELSDAVGLSLAGMAVGGLVGWVYRGVDSQNSADAPNPSAAIPIGITLTF